MEQSPAMGAGPSRAAAPPSPPTLGGPGGARPSGYYGIPPIHKPHWRWLIVLYFFLGGIAGGSYVLAAISELLGPRGDRRLVRAGRYLALAAILPCPVLLTLDLGQPGRFHHMFRVLKLRSPMSLGTWGLLSFGGVSAVSALVQAAEDGLLGGSLVARALRAVPARAVAAVGGGLGFFVGGYTGVLLGATAVPLWARNARLLGPLFLSAGLSGAAAALSLLLALRPAPHAAETLERLDRAERLALIAELGLLLAAKAHAGPLAAPLTTGRYAALYRYGVLGAGVAAPLLLRTLGPRLGLPTRPATIASSLLALAGGLATRYTLVMAGHASADDPQATFQLARQARAEERA